MNVEMVVIYLVSSVLASCLLVNAYLDVQCGSPKGKPAVLTYTGNAVAVFAFTAGGKKCKFNELTASASFRLVLGYKKAPGVDCVLEQSVPSRPSYGTIVETRTLHELVEGGKDEKFVVECVFTAVKKDIQVKVDVAQRFNPPKFILKNAGVSTAKSIFRIFVTDMNNRILTRPVNEGQIVKLRSSMVARGGEKGYQPIECSVLSLDQKVKLLVLSDGCGTGFPWRTNEGFQMKGRFGDTPNFRMFRIRKNEGFIIKCSFIVCLRTCDENSCHLNRGRKRRSLASTKTGTPGKDGLTKDSDRGGIVHAHLEVGHEGDAEDNTFEDEFAKFSNQEAS